MDFDFDRALSRLAREQAEKTRLAGLRLSSLQIRHNPRSSTAIPSSPSSQGPSRPCSVQVPTEVQQQTNVSDGENSQFDSGHSNSSSTSQRRSSKNLPSTRSLSPPSLQELCIQTLCHHGLAQCKSLQDIPDHLVVQVSDIVFLYFRQLIKF
jgi:hypothetical protein